MAIQPLDSGMYTNRFTRSHVHCVCECYLRQSRKKFQYCDSAHNSRSVMLPFLGHILYLVVPHTQPSMLFGGSQGHPRILPSFPHTRSPPGSLEDPMDIPGSSLVVPIHTVLQAVRRIPWTSQDPPWLSPIHSALHG